MDTESQPQNTDPSSEVMVSKKERRELRREERRSATSSLHKARSLRRAVLWIIAIAAIGGATASVIYLARNSNNTPNGDRQPLTSTISSADWVRGNSASTVTLIEYGDFQCPACAQYHPLVKGLKDEFGEKIAFGFRHFPLSQVHPNAKAAARAAEAAGAQGKFWEMHDILFERQTEWAPKPRPEATFVSYATELGINIDQFEADMDRDDLDDKIGAHYETGVASGVNSTPTFFLNGVKLQNPSSYKDFRHILTQAVEATNAPSANEPSPADTSITQPNESDLNAAKTNP